MDTPSKSRHINYVRSFLDGCKDPNDCDQFGDTFLHFLAKQGDGSLLGELVDAGADLNLENYLGQTPLHIAVIHRNRSMVNALLNFGALVDIYDCNGNSVLHSAINPCARNKDFNCDAPSCPHREPDMDIIKRLVEHEDMDLNKRNFQGCTALLWAVKDRNMDAVEALLEKSAEYR